MKFSPSRAHRWVGGGCTGSVKAEALAPKPPPSPTANEGTRLHDLAAQFLKGTRAHCELEDWEIIGPYVEDVRETHATLGGELKIEHWVRHREISPGIVDASLLTANRLIIWDLKTGWRIVEAERNWQLLLYAMMMAPGPGVEIELRIVQQPPWHPEDPVRSWVVPGMDPYMVQVRQAISQAKSTPTLVATPSNCLYCRAVTNCAAARNVTLGGMDMALRGGGPLPAEAVRPELVALRTAAKLIGSRLTALEAEAEERLRRGEAIPGCGLKAGNAGARAWTAELDKVRAVCAMVGQSADAPAAVRTPAQMIKAGVPLPLVESISKRNNPKMSVATDVSAQLQKLFSS